MWHVGPMSSGLLAMNFWMSWTNLQPSPLLHFSSVGPLYRDWQRFSTRSTLYGNGRALFWPFFCFFHSRLLRRGFLACGSLFSAEFSVVADVSSGLSLSTFPLFSVGGTSRDIMNLPVSKKPNDLRLEIFEWSSESYSFLIWQTPAIFPLKIL